MADINDGQQRRFANGGTLQIGADTVIQIGGDGAGMSFSSLPRRRLMATGMNQGSLQIPIEGEQQRGQLTLRLPYTGEWNETDSVFKKFLTASADGRPVTQDVVVTVFDKQGGPVGESFTFSGCFLDDQGVRYSVASGDDGDMFDVTLLHNAGQPVIAAVGA
ncbi:MAG: hypothetical protein AAFR96_09345 [Planctomycetota bacterium]